MNFEREKKINRLLLQAQRFKDPYLKVPIELAEFALKENFVSQAQIYLTGLYLYSGKVRIDSNPYQSIGKLCNVKERTVYNKIRSLKQRNWIGKDSDNGWIFFRGIDHVHQIEGWKYSRSALMFKDDFRHFKAFLIGAVIASFIKSRATRTDRISKGVKNRSQQSRCPVSISIIQKLLSVCEKTAYNYRKLAEKYRYIKMEQNLRQVTGITKKDISLMKQNSIESVDLRLFGSLDSISVHPKQLRSDRGYIYAQLPNLITPKVMIGKRNLNRSKPYPLTGLC